MTGTYLARQLLLERAKLSPVAAIERLVGMQAQVAKPPYLGLWTRLAKLTAGDLTKLLLAKTIVRAVAMRGTLHYMTARDFLALRAALQPGLTAGMASILRKRGEDLPTAAAIAFARTRLPCTFDALRDALAAEFPNHDTRALAYAVRMMLPLVQVPVAGEPFAFPAAAEFQAADTWLDKPIGPADPAELVRRYLRGYGPATIRDAQTWSGQPDLRAAFADLAPDGKLYDLPRPPAGDAATAPVRFIPAFDNLVLAHHDRARIIDDAHRAKVTTKNLQVNPTFLVGGRVAGTWKLDGATLSLSPFAKLARPVIAELRAEADALFAFLALPNGQFRVAPSS